MSEDELEVSVAIGVMARHDRLFSGADIRQCAIELGLVPQPDGRWFGYDTEGAPILWVEDWKARPLTGEAAVKTVGFSIVARPPAGGIGGFDRTVEVARTFAQALGGSLVDEHCCPLPETALAATRRALASILDKLEREGGELLAVVGVMP